MSDSGATQTDGLTAAELSNTMSEVKTITAREFARQQEKVINGLKADQTVAVTRKGKTVFLVSKPGRAARRRLRAKDLLKDLEALPMSEADGDAILQTFAREAVF